MSETNEFSFLLKPSSLGGVGVFAAHDISGNVFLALMPNNYKVRMLHESEIPKSHLIYCVARKNDMWACPEDFNRIEHLWYLNHSKTPNAARKSAGQFHSTRTIKAGEEVLLDYNSLDEPNNKKEDFYREGKK